MYVYVYFVLCSCYFVYFRCLCISCTSFVYHFAVLLFLVFLVWSTRAGPAACRKARQQRSCSVILLIIITVISVNMISIIIVITIVIIITIIIIIISSIIIITTCIISVILRTSHSRRPCSPPSCSSERRLPA